MNYSISIILPILNEINSLKKTLLIINKINVDKEFIVIYSEKLTKNSVKGEINSLKKKYKNFRCFKQIKPFVGGAIDLGIMKAKKKHIALMASDMETNPYELKNMIDVSSKNNNSIISADRWISSKGFSDYGFCSSTVSTPRKASCSCASPRRCCAYPMTKQPMR